VEEFLPVDALSSRAWEFSDLVIKNVNRCEVTENTEKIWEATLEDVQEGSCVGPMFSVGEVDQFVGTKCWIPTQRFEVVQKNKVRGVDSATVNGVNMATVVTEKIELPSTDVNVAALRWLRSHTVEGSNIQGWVLDERKAYRQIAVRPDQRKWSVIALRQPSSGKVAFFVMIGHSFGLVAAVYNYNRRSAAITDILRRLFFVAAFNFYDDKYGFEPEKPLALLRSKYHRRLIGGWAPSSIPKSCSSVLTLRSWGSHTISRRCTLRSNRPERKSSWTRSTRSSTLKFFHLVKQASSGEN
jgi:hypothetical protein